MPDTEYAELNPKDRERAERLRKIRKGFIIGAIAFVILVIIIPIAVYAGKRSGGHEPGEQKLTFTFDDMFNASFRPSTRSIEWGVGYYTFDSEEGDINKYNLSSGATEILVEKASVVKAGVSDWSAYFTSPDTRFVLLATEYVSKWRHSFSAVYYLYDVNSKAVTPLISATTRLWNVRWNPIHTSTLAYVLDNDIYIYDITTKQSTRVTDDGSHVFFNGVQSWVYEEEIFADYNAMWWSPDGSSLAYLKSNESGVPIYSFPVYSRDKPYNDKIDIPYPKPGYPNPSVSLHTYVLSTGVNTIYTFEAQWEYIYTVQWGSSSDVIFVQLLTRSQQARLIAKVTPATQTVTTLNVANLDTWFDLSPLVILDNYLISLEPDEHNSYMHLARRDLTGSIEMFLTDGAWNVANIVGWCAKAQKLFYISTEVGSMQRHLYSVDIKGNKVPVTTKSPAWYSASMSPYGEYYVLNYGGPEVPQQFIRSTTDENFGITLASNEEYASLIEKYDLPKIEYFTVKNEEGNDMNVKLFRPVDFKDGVKYPLVQYVYGGPGSQMSTYEHASPFWAAYLTTQGYVYASIDGRGTGGRDLGYLWATHQKLGVLESKDQIFGAESLTKARDFINETQRAIWGWSFGGFTTAMVMGSGSTVFKGGISVAPVTDWEFYDSVYTERYMGTPQSNPEGYNQSSVLERAKNIVSDTFLLVHGTGDDNVHFQNTAALETELVLNGIQFQSMNYINQNHRINRDGSYPHLYKLMAKFWEHKIPPPVLEEESAGGGEEE